VDVRAGQNVNVPINMVPRAGHVPISINIGSIVVGVTRARPMPAGGDLVGDTTRLVASVTYPNGAAVPGAKVSWATLNPAIAMVDSLGLVTSRTQGSTRIVATYAGFGASIDLTFVVADGTGGSPDRTPPQLTGFDASMDSVDMAFPSPPESENTQSVTFSMTAMDAVGVYAFSVSLRSPDGQTSKQCFSSTSGTPGSTTLYCSIALSRYGQAGRWTVEDLSIGDIRGNGRNFTAAELAAAGFDSGVIVYNTAVDNIAPVLDSIQFTPDTIYPDQGQRWLTVRAYVTDTQAGVDEISFGAMGLEPGGFGFGGQMMRAGPGVYEATLDVSSWPAGRVAITSVFIRDRANNLTYLNEADLDAQGISALLTLIR
ncbi:MAG TPA: Ig-like domain-containing protein, partial [Longimicrobium sp.]|nr:Ig-like domain-containing protein [Longimicrobium sp.]